MYTQKRILYIYIYILFSSACIVQYAALKCLLAGNEKKKINREKRKARVRRVGRKQVFTEEKKKKKQQQ